MIRTATLKRSLPALCAAACLLGWCSTASAHPVVGEVLPLVQPDGTRFEVRIWGDEFYTVVESLDGYTLLRDPVTQVICYARLAPDGNALLSTGLPAHEPLPHTVILTPHIRISAAATADQARAARADFEKRRYTGPLAPPAQRDARSPTTGNVLGLTLLIDFSDDPGTIAPSEVNNYCNQLGYSSWGNNGSVRDYFYEVSDNALTYTNYVPAAYYRAQHPKSYYTDPAISYGTRARELIIEALTYLDNNGLDFTQFDADNDNVVDALNCFYAGYSESAWAEGLWPHAWNVYFMSDDGVQTYAYQITDMQNSLALGTFCHENGHMLMGWPDLYDYDYDSTGVGMFCLMCYGASGTNPVEPCAYMKYTAGWTTTTMLSPPQAGIVVPADSNTIFMYPHETLSNEYYLIENRQRTDRDTGLPDDGLAIWHIDTYGSNNWQQQTPAYHYLVTLVQADGDWDFENNRNYGDSTDLWAGPSFSACTPNTYPNTDWWAGNESGLYITNISASATNMSFDLDQDCDDNGVADFTDMVGCGGSAWCDDCNGNGVLDVCDIAGGTSADGNANGIPDECEGIFPVGDLNCDGLVNNGDIDAFVLAITDPVGYDAAYPACDRDLADCNDDGSINNGDIDAFVSLLGG